MLRKLYKIYFKRLADVILSLCLLVVLAPFFPFLSLLIFLDTKGAVFFVQQRIGRYGHPFNLYKLRTMIDGAPNLAGLVASKGFFLQHQDDPRVTRVGRFLRCCSIDELPQLFNILKGDMSFAGPRPFIPEEFMSLKPEYLIRYIVRPGLTGLAQIKGRNDLSLEERMEYDACYVRHIGILMDISILLLTIPIVFKRKGVY
jgi:lipopolysaccharide/colanic/teichoic acid biosynthesis glycosyltransferase